MKQLKHLQIKPRKNSEASTEFEPMTCDIGAMLYWLSYEASPEAGQVRVQGSFCNCLKGNKGLQKIFLK